MAYAITRTCCNDASCVSVCPVNCIHPTPDEPEFGTTDMLYIDPAACIDCGACADACPVDAVHPVDRLRGPDTVFGDLNRDWYRDHPSDHAWGAPAFPRSLPDGLGPLRVAIVGTGPSAAYTAQELLRSTGAEITMIDRLPVTGGLLRHGVAPDHQSTKRIAESFAGVFHDPRLRMHLNLDVGADITHDELAAHHHAVVYAVGAAADRRLGIPGEDLPGSLPATTLVGWYNAEPTVPAEAVSLTSGERAVVVGNGNVAVDIARILLTDPDRLAATDIADHALAALRRSRVREVVLLARRGPEQAAWTRPEFLALRQLPGVDVVVDDHPEVRAAIGTAAPDSRAALLAGLPLERFDGEAEPGPGRRIVLRFLSAPTALTGHGRVAAVSVGRTTLAGERAEPTGEEDVIRAGLVVRSIGHRGVPVPGLPFDEAAATITHRGGRVVDPSTGRALTGAYVVGWAKRGPSGGIGANRACARETADALLDDAIARALPTPSGTRKDFDRLVRRRRPDAVGLKELRAVDRTERARGESQGRPRVKLATVPELLAAGRRRGSRRG
ncbi:4Fe-4S dicluster domain-containing protein [Streptomyces kaniharaensis]|uniref:ferredoxin--NADP(+) reductase n=1 Tax=Streptomyces kaniharaensis TaxID=212423 RepID=A0A6N7KRX3_9ACTN|nr:FAD-dependent oxidoreductase [Streptomyces kaniharaensis]MQS14372.1 4Fe-4S dicluster domain-containing protein [Streptomyces kaniharaensis]